MAATFDQYDKSRCVRKNSHVLIHRASVMLTLNIIGVIAFECAAVRSVSRHITAVAQKTVPCSLSVLDIGTLDRSSLVRALRLLALFKVSIPSSGRHVV